LQLAATYSQRQMSAFLGWRRAHKYADRRSPLLKARQVLLGRRTEPLNCVVIGLMSARTELSRSGCSVCLWGASATIIRMLISRRNVELTAAHRLSRLDLSVGMIHLGSRFEALPRRGRQDLVIVYWIHPP
jgi:hypothetical protein